MKILLIQPRMNKRPMDTDLKTRMAPSLALLTLMRLTPEEHTIVLFDENIEKADCYCDVDLVGITITLDVLPRAIHLAKKFREKGIPVVAGGTHVTCSPEECLPYFDALCIGFAERVWKRIIEDALQHKLQQIYHDMKDFQGDEIVSPLYEGIDRNKYLYTNIITTSRGCPHRCDFCYNSCKNRIFVQRPVKDVLAEIASLNTRHILFIDDNFIGNPLYTKELLTHLRGMNLKWNAAVTTNIVDYPDLLNLMAETGCQSLFIGFESINSVSLQGVHKHNNVEKYEAVIQAIHDRGMMINASLVLGLDGDNSDVFQRTLAFLVKYKIETLTSHILTPYPGTKLYQRMKNDGRIISDDLSLYNTAHVVFKPKNISTQELYQGYLWIYREFYSFMNIMRRMPNHKKQRRAYFLFNFCYRKFGKATSLLARIIPMHLLGHMGTRLSYRTK